MSFSLFPKRPWTLILISALFLLPARQAPASGSADRRQAVRGVVVDAEGQPVPGATIVLKGKKIGTMTDDSGKFTLSVESGKDILQVSCIGYRTEEAVLPEDGFIRFVLLEDTTQLSAIMVVAYGTQKKETLTGAISSVSSEQLLCSPNASVANALAGQISGLSSVQLSGQPGKENPEIYIRGTGSLSVGASRPLILVDGVERDFFSMNPNEIESVTVLKDASATAVFGVRGANGVVLVTTKRGKKGKGQVSLSSNFGVTVPTRILDYADSYTYAVSMNERDANDGLEPTFSDYVLDRFKYKDSPILYPDMDWRRYVMRPASFQTQHNLSLTGGTDLVKYFISLGYLHQDGLFRQFKELDYNNNYRYDRYNFRSNFDISLTKTTLLEVGIGGVVGNTGEPIFPLNPNGGYQSVWTQFNTSHPFSSPGVVDGKLLRVDPSTYHMELRDPLFYYGRGRSSSIDNRISADLVLTQKLPFLTKGLSLQVKASYNTNYRINKMYERRIENLIPRYYSSVYDPGMTENDPDFNKELIFQVDGQNVPMKYSHSFGKGRNWYVEASVRYHRAFGKHTVSALLLYNQSKKYYPKQFPELPSAYVGLVGRITYDYGQKYLAEINYGYNGSENFALKKRFGHFPAFSMGYVLSEEPFLKGSHFLSFLKFRASIGLVGNDNMAGNRYLYLADAYAAGLGKGQKDDPKLGNYKGGYNFGYDQNTYICGASETRLGNPDVTWEKALKSDYGLDLKLFDSRLSFSADYFLETRRDILISRRTIPGYSALSKDILPVINMGRVDNHGYELELSWRESRSNVHYFLTGNVSFARNEIKFMDEVEPNYEYMRQTGHPVGTLFGYVADGFYSPEDFDEDGKLISDVEPGAVVRPGDVRYRDLNGDKRIDTDDQRRIGFSIRPEYTFGFNYGVTYKGFGITMNWLGATNRSLLIDGAFKSPFMGDQNRALMQFHVDRRWTPETADAARMPRFSGINNVYNTKRSTLWVADGSYLRLKSMSLGYTFKRSSRLKKAGISALGLTFSGYNLLTFDRFKIMDPEASPRGAAGSSEGDTYPIVRNFMFGLNLTF